MTNADLIFITNLDGSAVQVRAGGVWRITHGLPDEAGVPNVRVDYEGGLQETDEPVARLLTDLTAAHVPMVRLTTPAVTAVYLNPSAVTSVQAAVVDVDAPGANSAIIVAGHRQAVVETPAEVMTALRIERPSGGL